MNIALILGKNYPTDFERYTLPILGRPVASYVIEAAKNTAGIDHVFLSTDSEKLRQIGSSSQGVTMIERSSSTLSLVEEIRSSLSKIEDVTGVRPNITVILFANSPCVTPNMLFNGVSFLENNPGYDSYVSTMQRSEFTPARLFSLDGGKLVRSRPQLDKLPQESYFLDHRVMVTRTENIVNANDNGMIESLLGENIHPVIQTSGVWDIDYPWQVPQIEHWLVSNGFTETKLPYEKLEKPGTKTAARSANKKLRVLVTTVPFGEFDSWPIEELGKIDSLELVINPINRKLKEHELRDMISDYDLLIAGTEPITRSVLENAHRLKLISRVGIGLDSVDLHAARDLGIKVSYTPDAPSAAVAELTIAHMLNLMRRLPTIDSAVRNGIWKRHQGDRLATKTIGLVGIGRIGTRVLKHLQGFHPERILINDLVQSPEVEKIFNAEWVSKEELYRESDIISLHIPLNKNNYNLISSSDIAQMKKTSYLINTSRGGIISEKDLYQALANGDLAGAAIDTFEKEPYGGKLVELDNCYISCHMGSMTKDCRARMEIEATQDVLRYINDEKLLQEVPESEYLV